MIKSPKKVGQFVNLEKAKDPVWGGGHLYKRNIMGMEKNEDIIAMAGKLG